MTAKSGLPCPTRSLACCSPIAPRGSRTASGPDKFPQTWDEYRTVGKQLKAKDRPYGQTLAHAFGDGPAFWYPYLWSWGGKEVEADGKTVALNSKETIKSVKFAVAFWKECFDAGGLSWDDAGNNRAFLSNTISSTSNGASIYLLARSKPDTYLSEKGTPIYKDMFHAPLPKGPGGQFSYHVPFSNIVPAYTPNQKAAKDFLRWFQSKDIYGQWFTSQQGFSVGSTKVWEQDPVWKVDPVMAPYRTAALSGRFAGYAGPAGRAAAEAISKFIIVDMYTKAVQGMAPERLGQMGARRNGGDLQRVAYLPTHRRLPTAEADAPMAGFEFVMAGLTRPSTAASRRPTVPLDTGSSPGMTKADAGRTIRDDFACRRKPAKWSEAHATTLWEVKHRLVFWLLGCSARANAAGSGARYQI